MNNNIYIGMVGFQPAAVAVSVKTLCRNSYPPEEIVLLHTGTLGGTLSQARRLEIFFQSAQGKEKGWLPDSTRITLRQYDFFKLEEVVRALEELHKAGKVIWYDCTAGPNYQQARVAMLTRDLAGITILYSEEKMTCRVGGGREDKWKSENIGLEALLALHGLERKGGYIRKKESLRQRFGPFDRLYEQRGRLYGIYGREVQGPEMARKITSDIHDRAFWDGLRPRILLETTDPTVFYRLQGDLMDAVYTGQKFGPSKAARMRQRKKNWQQEKPSAPGSVPQAKDDPGPLVKGPFPGGGGSDPPLLVCMGNDPSATLVALCSHRPKKAVVLYDGSTLVVREMVQRLLDHAQGLPVGELMPKKIDLGGKLNFKAVQDLLPGEDSIDANISPGSKAQAWSLSRLPQSPIRLWSIDNRRQMVPSLTTPGQSLAKALPPSLLQAGIVGGELQDNGRAFLPSDDQQQVLHALVTACAEKCRAGSPRLVPAALGCTQVCGGTLYTKYVSTKKLWRVDFKRKGKKFRLEFPGHRGKTQGFWFENVVAAALGRAGLTDIILGVKWRHTHKNEDSNHFRTELDIIGKWKNTFTAISVKSYALEKDSFVIHHQAIISEAMKRMGRFCLPVLIRPFGGTSRSCPEALLEIDARFLDDSDKLEEMLDNFLKKKQTS